MNKTIRTDKTGVVYVLNSDELTQIANEVKEKIITQLYYSQKLAKDVTPERLAGSIIVTIKENNIFGKLVSRLFAKNKNIQLAKQPKLVRKLRPWGLIDAIHDGIYSITGKDVYETIISGADGTGCTSGIVCAKDPEAMVKEMLDAIEKAVKEKG